ncbi:MAG: aspartate--tRNA ligase [Peptococcaceae bacterium]|nr:aspartate--tRNA ligase [Peptococcaceae bacterium]MBR2008885.1 aspartate--tRNA ligase [Peptococcaceae bacterium]
MLKRTHNCNDLRKEHVGQEVILMGWAQKRRDHGGVIFIDLRDRSGIAQVTASPETCSEEVFQAADSVRSEYVLAVKGTVRLRPEGMTNDKLETGEIDVVATELVILNKAKTPPFYLTDDVDVDENIRLKYRYLDLRRPEMKNNIMLRHRVVKAMRDYLDEQGFLEIETPILQKSTPEGARDYLVPSRVHEGEFFALPQSPQQFKQLLMVAGMEKYFQIARCFRDEDLRADRQPEFTQLDMELSFVDEEDIMTLNEGLIKHIFKVGLDRDIETPFRRMTWDEAMNKYGSDKPDLRFGLEMVDLSDIAKGCGFKVFDQAVAKGGVVKAINAKGGVHKLSRRDIDALTKYVSIYGAKGLAYFSISDENEVKSPLLKFLSEEEVKAIFDRVGAEPGDIIFCVADTFKTTCDALGHLRLELGRRFDLIDEDELSFLWVTEFPLLEWDDETERYYAMHHPFTCPMMEDVPLMETDPGKVRARAYDMVLNGVEVGGGSIRIHDGELQEKMFKLLNMAPEEYTEQFSGLLNAFQYGAPPHGGLAFGVDRLLMLMAKRDTIRDVIPFPKTQSAMDVMMEAPSPVADAQLHELHIKLDIKEK